jgi:hypothetical protein
MVEGIEKLDSRSARKNANPLIMVFRSAARRLTVRSLSGSSDCRLLLLKRAGGLLAGLE